MAIPFIQYMRPSGLPVAKSITRPADVEARAMRIIERGWRFEAEVLTDGMVSFTIAGASDLHSDGEEVDLVCLLCPNGPPVLITVDVLVAKGVALLEEEARACG